MCHLCQRNLSSFFTQDSRNRMLPMTVKPSAIGRMGGRNTETINDRKQLSACIRRRGIDAMFCGELPHFFLRHYSPGELLTNPFSPSEYLKIIVEGTVLLYDMPDEESTVILQTTNNKVEILGDLELLDAKFTPPFLWRRRRSSIPSRSIWSSTGSSF